MSKISGIANQNFPEPGEKSSLQSGGRVTGTGKGSGSAKSNPFTHTYDAFAPAKPAKAPGGGSVESVR